jgi:hypothetical protein
MFGTQDETVIKLHTAANGHVWYSRGIGPTKNSQQIVDSFLLSPFIAGVGLTFRILGLPQNAELICSMYERRYKGEVRSVEIAGPNVLHSPDELQDPALTVSRMRSVASSPACGGWHELTMKDYPTYAMLSRMTRNNFVFDDTANSYFHLHPAYRALSFIPTMQAAQAARMLISIVDPRWYVERRRPDRAKKLELYMGLTPTVQRRVSDSEVLLTKSRDLRCNSVLCSWQGETPEDVDLKNPANFLYRIYAAAGGGYRGDLRASQAFLRYVNSNWLSALESRKGAKDGLFAPNLFFKSPAEVEAYTRHMQKPPEGH